MKKVLITCIFFISNYYSYAQTLHELLATPGETYQSICTKMEEKLRLQKINEAEVKRERKEHLREIKNESEEEFENEEVMFNRWRWYKGSHLAPGGKMINETQKNWDEFYSYQNNNQQYFNNAVINGEWTSLGPTNIINQGGAGGGIGRINRIVRDPVSPTTIYAGSANGGLWKTTNAASSWFCLTDGLPRIGVSGIAINPANTNEIYILTGDGDYGTCPSIGVLKTNDGGISWHQTGLTFSDNNAATIVVGRKIIIDPVNPNNLFAITDKGIYRTTDAGSNWTQLWGANMRDIHFNTAAPGIVYATGNSYSAGNKTKFYRSLNGGINWDSSGFSGWPDKALTISKLGITPANSGYLYAYLAKNMGATDSVFIYRSINNGTSFNLQYTFPVIYFGQVGLDDAIAVSPTNANEVYLGCLNAWKSTTGGTSFNQITIWSPSGGTNYVHADHHDITFANNTLYIGCDGGVYKSTDNGVTWIFASNGLAIEQTTHLAGIQSNPNLYYYGSFDNGVQKYNNSPTATVVMQGDGFYCAIDPTNENIAYGDINGGQNKTTDGGLTWNWINDSASMQGFIDDGMNPMVINPSNTNILYGANRRVYKSINGGTTWTKMLADSTSAYFALALCKTKPNNIWGSTNSKVQRFNGTTWFNATGNLPAMNFGFKVLQIAAHPTDSLTAWVALCGYTAGQKIYKTTTGGTSWTNVSGTLPNVPFNSIVYDETNGDLYAGSDIGVFFRNTSMSDWVPFMNGLPRVSVQDLYINYTNSTITAGTYGRGLWRSPLQTICYSSIIFLAGFTAPHIGFASYESGSYIHSNMLINHGFGDSILYKAATEITLSPGFEVTNQSLFVASIGACNVFSPRILNGYLSENSADENSIPFSINNTIIPADNGLKLFPNPASESVYLSIDAQNGNIKSVYLSDLLGKNIRTFENINSDFNDFRIDVKGIKVGTYLVTVVADDTKKLTQRLIINPK